jgi:2-desacetyl-2-hydroxyethyl bacteriochlorophyllide A dehydrogenase
VEPGAPLEDRDGVELEPGLTDVVVAVEAAGICRSDVHYRGGFPTTAFLPITLGHEVAGRIVAAGADVAPSRIGERVALHYQTSCGTCSHCVGGHEQFCPEGQMLGKSRHGGYAEQIVVPAGNAHAIPDGVTSEQAAVMMCSTATAYHALRKGRLQPGERVAVLGVGGLGMSAVQLARELGADTVYAVDIDRDRLALAHAHGAEPVEADATDVAAHLVAEGGVDVALDLLGSVELVRTGLDALRPMGRVVAVGLVDDAVPVRPYDDLIIGERELIGCSDHLGSEIPELLAMAAARRIDVASVITDRVPLEARAIDAAMDRLERFRGGVRTVIDVAGTPFERSGRP